MQKCLKIHQLNLIKIINEDLKKLVKGVKEEKEKELQYGSERYKNLPEDEKRKIVKYRI